MLHYELFSYLSVCCSKFQSVTICHGFISIKVKIIQLFLGKDRHFAFRVSVVSVKNEAMKIEKKFLFIYNIYIIYK